MTTTTNKTPRTMAAQMAAAYAHETAYKDLCATMRTAKVRATVSMHDAHVCVYKAVNKYIAKAHAAYARGMYVPTMRVGNSAAKKAEITARDAQRALGRIAEKAVIRDAQQQGISVLTLACRRAQGSAQKAINAVRALARMVEPKKPCVVHTPVVHTPTAKVRAPKRVRVYHMMHTIESVAQRTAEREELALLEAQYQALLAKYKADKEIARARRAAQRKVWIQLRAEKVARMCANAWYNKGIWIDPALAEACNDSDYSIRVSAYTELCALVGVAA